MNLAAYGAGGMIEHTAFRSAILSVLGKLKASC